MKNFTKKIAAFLCIFAIALFPFNVSAATDEKLYEKYGYQENFEYSDVMIGHALKASVTKIFLHYTAELSYSPVTFDEDALLSDYTALYNRYYTTNTNEEIAAALLQYAQENIGDYLTYSGTKVVNTSGSWMGSGVVISEDGYIATNAHVATVNDDSRLQLYLNGLQGEVLQDVEDVLYAMNEYGLTMTDEEAEQLYYVILEDAATKTDVIDEEITLEVCFPTANGDTDIDSATIYEAELVAEGTQDGIDGLTQDTAILKVDVDNMVALKLSDSLPETNSTIVSAGYPAASDEAFQESGSEASVLSVTVGTGQVARLIPIEGTDYQAIQVTTTISGGNSGGPSVDTSLNVEGLNTYVHGGDARYAYMVSAEYVKDLTNEFDLEHNEATKTFLTGLQMLQQGYGDAAEECFLRVRELQKDTPYIKSLIQLAKEAPDETPPVASKVPMWLVIVIAAGVAVVIIVVILIIVISKKKKAKKVSEGIDVTGVNPPPVTPMSPVTPIPPVPPVTPVMPPVTPVRPVSPANPVPPLDEMPAPSPVNTPYGGGVELEPAEPLLRSTMRTSSEKPAEEPKQQENSGGSRLIWSENLKKDE